MLDNMNYIKKYWFKKGQIPKCKKYSYKYARDLLIYRQYIMGSKKYRKLIYDVKKKYSLTCQRCGKNDLYAKYIVHHIKPVIVGDDKNVLDINNCVLLCTKCHGFVHSSRNKEHLFIKQNKVMS